MDMMPAIAYGSTYTTDEDAYRTVSDALNVGYRIFNTCAAYGNEKGMGKALSEISRDEVTIISLDSNAKRSSSTPLYFDGYKASMNQIYDTLENLKTSYIDLYMINWPIPRYMEKVWRTLNADTWRAMEECLKKGLIRHLGVSNFLPLHLEALKKTATLPIEVNQLEIHPNYQQRETVEYCRKSGLQIMAWSPLFKGKAAQLPKIMEIANIYGKTPAQIVLRWDIQHSVLPIVHSSKEDRMKSNLDVFDFELSDKDMKEIDNLESGEHVKAFSYTRQEKSLEELQ